MKGAERVQFLRKMGDLAVASSYLLDLIRRAEQAATRKSRAASAAPAPLARVA